MYYLTKNVFNCKPILSLYYEWDQNEQELTTENILYSLPNPVTVTFKNKTYNDAVHYLLEVVMRLGRIYE